MATTLAELEVKITTDLGNIKSDMAKLKGNLDKSSKSTLTLGKAFKALGAVAAAAGISKLAKSMVSLASEAEETRNKFNVVFSDIRKDATAAAKNLSQNFGLSSQASQQLLSDTGDLLTGFGLAQDEALRLSDAAAQLGADLASFTNYSGGAKGATDALAAAMLGERERVKSLGIAITETDLKKFAADQGKVWESMSRGERATLTLELALKQSKNAIGDFARSQNSFANVQRRLNARFQDMGAELGDQLLPALSDLGVAFLEASKDGGILKRIMDAIVTSIAIAINQISIFVNTLNAMNRNSQIEEIDKKLVSLRKRFKELRKDTEGNRNALRENLKEQDRLIKLRSGEVTQIQDLNSTVDQLRKNQAKEIDTINDIIAGREYQLQKHKELEDKKTKATKDGAEERKDIEEYTLKQQVQSMLSIAQLLTSQLSGILNQYITNRQINLDNQQDREQQRIDQEYERRKEEIENNITDEEELAEALKALDEEKARESELIQERFEKKRRKMQRDAARKQKQLAIAETLITIPQAAFQAFTAAQVLPYPANLIVGAASAAAATALGLAKLSLIKQQPLPEAARGGVFDRPYIGGEAGKEMAVPLESDNGRNAIRELASGMLDVMSQQADTRASVSQGGQQAASSGGDVYLDGEKVGRWITKGSTNGLFTIDSKVVVA